MYWYVIPIFAHTFNNGEGDITHYVPGVGLPGNVVESSIPGMCHAHVPKNAPTSCLMGVESPPVSVPEGWTAKTLQEAKDYFESVYLRVPSANEVF
jgi:hypothetical protein